ncbi:MAG: hypothetical protein HFH93_12260 [Lachnospiraceae bacterium]|mgnify:CR=1 FL=1|nr:hypothetical protein [Lachnospiraceae bacterium]
MDERERLERALEALRKFVCGLAEQAGESEAYAQGLWEGIRHSGGLLSELAYYYDNGEFLCEYQVAGYTLADILVWQVDHFKLYMDRPEDMNRYRQPRLLLASFDTMLQMEKNPEAFAEKMRCETGQDIR